MNLPRRTQPSNASPSSAVICGSKVFSTATERTTTRATDPTAEAGVEGSAERLDLGQFRHRG